MAHLVQKKIEIVETLELAVGRRITVGLQWDDARVAAIATVIGDRGFAVGHHWIDETVGEVENVRARLNFNGTQVN